MYDTLKYNSFCRKTLKYDTFCRETLKYGTFCRKNLDYALRAKKKANMRGDPTPHFMLLWRDNNLNLRYPLKSLMLSWLGGHSCLSAVSSSCMILMYIIYNSTDKEEQIPPMGRNNTSLGSKHCQVYEQGGPVPPNNSVIFSLWRCFLFCGTDESHIL